MYSYKGLESKLTTALDCIWTAISGGIILVYRLDRQLDEAILNNKVSKEDLM